MAQPNGVPPPQTPNPYYGYERSVDDRRKRIEHASRKFLGLPIEEAMQFTSGIGAWGLIGVVAVICTFLLCVILGLGVLFAVFGKVVVVDHTAQSQPAPIIQNAPAQAATPVNVLEGFEVYFVDSEGNELPPLPYIGNKKQK